ncbi:MAG: NUDIX domain-containing protein, partial [Candidatus Brennerbacteria bacterium]|nr:NUDIX domain-containing protein [Candidatus Brennerbacteria bacterium]
NGYWNFAKGKIEGVSETAFRAALREVKEETGLSGRDLKFKEYFKVYDRFSFMREKEKIFKIVVYYLAETRQSYIKVSDEHDGYGWFLYKDAVKLLKYQNLKDNLKQAYDRIRPKNLQRRQINSPRQNFNLQRSGGPRQPA